MRISYNLHGQNIKDKPRLLAHLRATAPAWVLVMDNLELAREIKAALPATNVIFRAWPDDDIHKRVSPADWVNQKAAAIGGADVWCYTTNEPGFSDDVLNWTNAVIELAAARGLKLCVGNFSSGTPEPDDWHRPAAIRLLHLCDSHRDTVVLGLHEYSGGVITSGMISGSPAFIQPSDWPRRVENVACWHVGRVRLLLQACDWLSVSIKPPRIVITEAGFDDMSDIKTWLDGLLKTPPYTSIRGWKSLWNQWRAWWPTWTPQKAYFEQLKYADNVLYKDTPVEGMLMFSWGASSEMWQQFDVSDANELQGLLEAYANEGTPTAPPPRKYAPGAYTCADTTPFNIRALPSISAGKQGSLMPGDAVKALDVDAVAADGLTWQKFEVTPKAAPNLLITGWIAVTDLDLTPKVTEPPAPPPVVLQFSKAELLALATSHDTAATSHQAIAALYRRLAEKAA